MVDHYYSKESKSTFIPNEFVTEFEGRKLSFVSGSGVFSIGKIDDCSDVLVKYCDVTSGQHILDLGCGFGPVGICLLSKFKDVTCDFSDVNKRATHLTKINLKNNKISDERTHIYTGEGFEKLAGNKYDVILLNPPQSAGRQLCNKLISDAKEYLKENGSVQIVARHNVGGAMFEKFMKETYGNCETLARKGGMRVYKSVFSSDDSIDVNSNGLSKNDVLD